MATDPQFQEPGAYMASSGEKFYMNRHLNITGITETRNHLP